MVEKTINKIKVHNMTSPNGNLVPNQFTIRTDDGQYFQSYNSIIVFIDNDYNVFLDEYYWDYSRTTGIYRNQFLGEDIKTTREKIKSGKYKLTNLN